VVFINLYIFVTMILKNDLIINLKNNKMRKLVSILAVAAFMFSMNVNAQEPKQKAKAVKAKTEKSCDSGKKSCCSDSKSGGCCSSKKAVAKK